MLRRALRGRDEVHFCLPLGWMCTIGDLISELLSLQMQAFTRVLTLARQNDLEGSSSEHTQFGQCSLTRPLAESELETFH